MDKITASVEVTVRCAGRACSKRCLFFNKSKTDCVYKCLLFNSRLIDNGVRGDTVVVYRCCECKNSFIDKCKNESEKR